MRRNRRPRRVRSLATINSCQSRATHNHPPSLSFSFCSSLLRSTSKPSTAQLSQPQSPPNVPLVVPSVGAVNNNRHCLPPEPIRFNRPCHLRIDHTRKSWLNEQREVGSSRAKRDLAGAQHRANGRVTEESGNVDSTRRNKRERWGCRKRLCMVVWLFVSSRDLRAANK